MEIRCEIMTRVLQLLILSSNTIALPTHSLSHDVTKTDQSTNIITDKNTTSSDRTDSYFNQVSDGQAEDPPAKSVDRHGTQS